MKETEIVARNFALGFVTAAQLLPDFSIAAVEEMISAMQEQLEIDRNTAVWYGNQAVSARIGRPKTALLD